jgi:hypothetical protein
MKSMKINPWKFILFFFFCKLILWKHNFIVWIRLCPSKCLWSQSWWINLLTSFSLRRYPVLTQETKTQVFAVSEGTEELCSDPALGEPSAPESCSGSQAQQCHWTSKFSQHGGTKYSLKKKTKKPNMGQTFIFQNVQK